MSKARDLATFGNVADDIGRKNLIINGAMQVAQRGTVSLGAVAGGYGGPDRFRMSNSTDAVLDLKQSTDVPSGQGFAHSYQIDVTTADASIGASQQSALEYRIEGQDLQMLKKGSSNAESVTLSFWVKSPVTGTHIVELEDTDNTRTISKSYTVSSADTWQFVSLTYEGDTTGSLNNDNTLSIRIRWYFDAGTNFTSGTLATSWQAANSPDRAAGQTTGFFADVANNWYLTGVQLEVGSVATPFEHRSYGEELALCQRYFLKYGGQAAYERVANGFSSSTSAKVVLTDKNMRATPSLTYGGNWRLATGTTLPSVTSFVSNSQSCARSPLFNCNIASSFSGGELSQLSTDNDTSAYLHLDAEL